MKFSVGEEVTWISGAQGTQKKKRGIVEAVIPAGQRPTAEQSKQADAYGAPRDHESYLVRVAGKTPTSKGKLYWPRTGQLESAVNLQMSLDEAIARAESWQKSPSIRPDPNMAKAVAATLLAEIEKLNNELDMCKSNTGKRT